MSDFHLYRNDPAGWIKENHLNLTLTPFDVIVLNFPRKDGVETSFHNDRTVKAIFPPCRVHVPSMLM